MTYIDTLPTPPSRNDDKTEFSTKADAFLGALPDFVAQANALSDEVDAMRDDAEAKRAATAVLRDETVVINGAAEDARDLAMTYRDTAGTYRGQAETARDQAQTAAAAAGSAAGLPSLSGNAGKQLVVSAGEGGVEWGTGLRRVLLFSDESDTEAFVACESMIGQEIRPITEPSVLHVTSQFFLATTSASSILTSPDGITWTSRTPGLSGTPLAAATASGTVVALISGQTATRRSTDHGITWSAGGTFPTACTLLRQCNGVFLAQSTAALYRSTDGGVTWGTVSKPDATVGSGIYATKDLFLFRNGSSPYGYHVSADGLTWTGYSSPTGYIVNPTPDVLVAIPTDAATGVQSTDGINWTPLPSGMTYKHSDRVRTINGVHVAAPGTLASDGFSHILRGGRPRTVFWKYSANGSQWVIKDSILLCFGSGKQICRVDINDTYCYIAG